MTEVFIYEEDRDTKETLPQKGLGGYHLPRGEWQDRFGEFLDRNDFDGYGIPYGKVRKWADKGKYYEFENDVFILRPYEWNIEERFNLPNFVFKPTGFELKWYKYPLRGAVADTFITYEEFDDMLNQCEESMYYFK